MNDFGVASNKAGEFHVTALEVIGSDESWEATAALLAPNPDKEEAQLIREEIDYITDAIAAKEAWLQIGWIKLGMLVHRVREKKHWQGYNFQSFPAFVEDIATRVDRKRSYIYQCKGIAEKLLPQLGAQQLVEMGITNAGEITKLAVGGKPIPAEVVERALTAKTSEMKAVVQTILHPQTVVETGKWFDVGGFYMTDPEYLEYLEAYNLALNDTDFPVPTDLPEHVEKKIVITRWYQEYRSTYGGPQ